MSDSKDLAKELPSMQKTITLDVIGKVTGKRFVGDFVFDIPSGKMKAKADIKRAQLNGGVDERYLDETVGQFHYWIGYLFYSISEAPKWWKDAEFGYNLHDVNVVQDLFNSCMTFEAEWMKKVWGDGSNEQPKEPS